MEQEEQAEFGSAAVPEPEEFGSAAMPEPAEFGRAATPEEEWKNRAAEQQQSFKILARVKKWIKKFRFEMKQNPETFVRSFVETDMSIALYGSLYSDCNVEEQNNIDIVQNHILEAWNKTERIIVLKFNYTYVSTWNEIHDGVVPLVCIKIGDSLIDTILFVDTKGVYSSWYEYLQMNKLSDDLYICYPKGGIYDVNSEFVDVKYARCGLLRDPEKVVEEAGSLQPVPSVRFFPLYEPFFHVEFSDDDSDHLLITIKRIQDDGKPYTDVHSLAMWFKMLVPIYGTETTEEPDTTKLRIEKARAQKAMELFELFYESPYSVHGFFVVVYLMKMLAARRINLPNTADECRKSAGMLKYVLNFSILDETLLETFIDTLFENYSLNNMFKFKSRYGLSEVGGDINSGRGISDILSKITETKQFPHSVANQRIQKLIIDLNEIVRREYREGINASSIGLQVSALVGKRFSYKSFDFVAEKKGRRLRLRKKLPKEFGKSIKKELNEDFTNVEVDAMLGCFEKIDALIKKDESRSVIKMGFFKFCAKFCNTYSSCRQDSGTSKDRAYRFLIGKYLSVLAVYLAQNADIANIQRNITRLCEIFVEEVEELTTDELMKECVRLDRIFNKNHLFIYFFNYEGIRVNAYTTDSLTPRYRNSISRNVFAGARIIDIELFFQRDHYLEMARYYLDIDDNLPQNPHQFKDHRIWMHSRNGKFVLTIPFTPKRGETESTYKSFGFAGIVLMFRAVPPNVHVLL